MTRPTRVKVGYQTYSIQWIDAKAWELNGFDDDGGCVGKTNQFRGVIHIKAIYPEDVLRETLMHELIHAAIHTARLHEYIDKDGAEEWFANTQAPSLFAVFRENPKIRKYLFEEK